jgi:transglutaminase-like putative cysteine protease
MSRAQRDIWNTAITWFLYTSEDRADKGLSPAFDSTLAEAEALRRYPDSPCTTTREIIAKSVREIVVEWLDASHILLWLQCQPYKKIRSRILAAIEKERTNETRKDR